MTIIKVYENDKIVKNVIHLSDIHIRTGNSKNSRYNEYKSVISKLILELNKYNKENTFENTIIFITGDLFHHKNIIEAHGIDIFNLLIIELTKLTTVYIIRGNHDYRQDNLDDIDLIGALIKNSNYENLHYLDETGLYEIGDILVGLVAIQDTLKKGDTSGKVDEMPDFPWTTHKKYKRTIALFHGIIVEDKKTIYHNPIKVDWISNYDFGLLGDIHKQQVHNSVWNKKGFYDIKNKTEIMWGYPGSLVQQNFGELYNKHGYLVWDLENYKVYSQDIENQYGFFNLYFKDDKWQIKINNKNFKDKFIDFNKFLSKRKYITNPIIQIKKGKVLNINSNKNQTDENQIEIEIEGNVETDDIESIKNILSSHNIFVNDENRIIKNINSYEGTRDSTSTNTNDEHNSNIKEYNSINTWIEFVNENTNEENSLILNEFDWKNIIENPDSLIIQTDNLPISIIEKVEKKNKTVEKLINQYLTMRDEVSISNNLELLYIEWEWILCYQGGCYFNFSNMEGNVMLLNAENGHGKSSFLEIIVLGLFGSSIPSRHNKQFSSSVICKKKPSRTASKIRLKFKLNTIEYLIVRVFSIKSNDNNKLEQKVELFRINTSKKSNIDDNLIFMNSGITAINEWITNNIGNSNTFFQSCMHTQNSDNNLFSMNSKDQKELMDNSLSLNSMKYLINIFKNTTMNQKIILDNIGTLRNDIELNLKPVNKEDVKILLTECTTLNKTINELQIEIDSNKFPSDIDTNDINNNIHNIMKKIKEINNEMGQDKFKDIHQFELNNKESGVDNLNEIYTFKGILMSLIKQYKENLKYYSIEYASKSDNKFNKNDTNGICNSGDILHINDIESIRRINKKLGEKNLSKESKKLSEIKKENNLIKEYFEEYENNQDENNQDENNSESKNDINNLEKDLSNKNEIIVSSNNEIKNILIEMNSIIINFSYEEIKSFQDKLNEMKINEGDKKLKLQENIKLKEIIIKDLSELKNKKGQIVETQKIVNEIEMNDYPFNPDCECCLKQPWKIQLNNLEVKLKDLNKDKLKIEENLVKIVSDSNEEIIETFLKNIKNEIIEIQNWFNTYNDLIKNEKKYNKQLKLINKKEKLSTKRGDIENKLIDIKEEIKIIENELNNINKKIKHGEWLRRRENNMIDNKNYKLYSKSIIDEWNEIHQYKNCINNFIKDYDEYNNLIKNLEYWEKINSLKPKWEDVEKKKQEISKKRRYLLNITNKYQNLKNSNDIYMKECKNLENYKKIILEIEKKNQGVNVLWDLFNNFRIWLYKEKLFPLILKKNNLIIGNMSKNNEKLQLDIVWTDEVFNWFIIHNGNKIIINKASGFQKFIIDLSMRITLSSIGISSLKCNQLFIDEGFSSCDNFHLEKIPIFLNSLLEIYKSVLVVSHINEIQNSTSLSYNIKRENNLSIIDYGNDNRENMVKMIEIANGLKKIK